jgi:ACS family hexuronate transporter-like MFS transporter
LATGIFNSGTNIGAIAVPFTIPFLAETYGWKMAFILTGSVGFIWLILWIIFYEIPSKQKRLGAAELAYINSDKDEQEQDSTQPKQSWAKLLTYRQTWAFVLGKFFTDPVWWY